MVKSEYIFTLSSGVEIPVIITTRRGLRNITLRPKTRGKMEIHISKPWLVSTSSALKFLEQKRAWCENIFQNAGGEKSYVQPGDTIEIFGRQTTIYQDSSLRGNSFCVNPDDTATLIIGGGVDMFHRRVRDWVKSEFLIQAKQMVRSAPRELAPRRITVRDTTTRWGSCSTSGTMSLSWRLAFAPRDVMRYVVMHELAHRKHMNHSAEFWDYVGELYGFGVERARRWLKIHGGELHRYV